MKPWTANRCIYELKKGQGLVAEHINTISLLAHDLDWNNAGLANQF